MQIQIAPPYFHDWEALLQLLQQAFAFMDGRIDPPSSLTAMGVQDLKAKAAVETLIVALADAPAGRPGDLLGCAFAAVRDDCVYVGKVAVAAAARGQGIARAMLAAADEVARAHGRPCLELQTRIELVENQATFAALGFETVRETAHPGYSRTTSLTLRRPVAADAR